MLGKRRALAAARPVLAAETDVKQTEKNIVYRALILGVPRSGKSRLAQRLACALELNHYPLDSLVSALGESFPSVQVGRQFEDSVSTTALQPFLASWVQHLDYEGCSYILEGYHIGTGTASSLAGQGFKVAVLGSHSVSVAQKCRDIRAHASSGDWTEGFSDSELADLVERYQVESGRLQAECEELGLAFYDIGRASDAELDLVLKQLSNEGREEE